MSPAGPTGPIDRIRLHYLDNEFAALIVKYAKDAGIMFTDAEADLCTRHISLMLEWNRRLNLTRIVSHDDIIVKHLLDSIVPVKNLPHSGRALDVGTGAGFPGIPLKIMSPALDFLLLDSNRKKVSFLASAAAKLGLNDLRAKQGRWEELAESHENRGTFQLITMRAVKLEQVHLTVLASRLLASGGIFAFWAGPDSEHSTAAISDSQVHDLDFLGSFLYSLPGISRERSILTWQKS